MRTSRAIRRVAIQQSFLAASLVAAGALTHDELVNAAESDKHNTLVDKTSAALTTPRAKADTDAVLDAHAGLKPKAIEAVDLKSAFGISPGDQAVKQ